MSRHIARMTESYCKCRSTGCLGEAVTRSVGSPGGELPISPCSESFLSISFLCLKIIRKPYDHHHFHESVVLIILLYRCLSLLENKYMYRPKRPLLARTARSPHIHRFHRHNAKVFPVWRVEQAGLRFS